MVYPNIPFEPLVFEEDTYTFNNCTKLVLFSNGKYLIPSFNQYTVNTDKCTLDETPCGGVKNVRILDMFPGTLSIEGKDCFLKTSGGHVGKTISAGQFAESSDIITSGPDGIAYCSANEIEYLAANEESYLVTPSNTIVCQFQVFNASATAQTCKILIRCPDNVLYTLHGLSVVPDIKIYNRDSVTYEDTTFVKTSMDSGTVNAYYFDRVIAPYAHENLQIMIKYRDLTWSYKFESSENPATGLWNLNTFLAFYDPTTKDVNYLLFMKVPDSLTCTMNSVGDVTQLVIPKSDNVVYYGKMKYAPISQMTGEIPKCFISSESGSLAEFLKRYFAIVDTNVNLKTYVVPAISDEKILPASSISSRYLSNSMSCRISKGESHPLSFVLRSNKDVTLTIEVSDLVNESNLIPRENIDIKYVKCWYQAGCDIKNTHQFGHFLTPELLINDDELVRTNCDEWDTWNLSNPYAKNELKLSTGEYIDITTETPSSSGQIKPTITECPIYDAATLQPLWLPKNYNKQVWVTVEAPDDAVAGTYLSTISIKAGETVIRTITLSVEILSIHLLAPWIEYSIYYRGILSNEGTISSEQKNIEQYTAEQLDMYKHGITNPVMYNQGTYITQALSVRQNVGLDNTNLYYLGLKINNTVSSINAFMASVNTYVTKLFVYGYDEASMNDSDARAKIQAIHDAGHGVFCAQSATLALQVADILDLCIGNSGITSDVIEAYYANSHKVYSYANPQTVPEYPRQFRQNYGLYLWQLEYDGAMPYAYQHSMQFIWSDYDDEMYRDHAFTYPTANGVIDTIQWEGFREGVTDIRYMATLTAVRTEASALGIDVSDIDVWTHSIKTSDLSTLDLDAVREQMITYILQLREAIA